MSDRSKSFFGKIRDAFKPECAEKKEKKVLIVDDEKDLLKELTKIKN